MHGTGCPCRSTKERIHVLKMKMNKLVDYFVDVNLMSHLIDDMGRFMVIVPRRLCVCVCARRYGYTRVT